MRNPEGKLSNPRREMRNPARESSNPRREKRNVAREILISFKDYSKFGENLNNQLFIN